MTKRVITYLRTKKHVKILERAIFCKGITYEVLPERQGSKNDVANVRQLSLLHALKNILSLLLYIIFIQCIILMFRKADLLQHLLHTTSATFYPCSLKKK